MQIANGRSSRPVGFFVAALGVAYTLYRRWKQQQRNAARVVSSMIPKSLLLRSTATNGCSNHVEDCKSVTAQSTKPGTQAQATKNGRTLKVEDAETERKRPPLDPRLKHHIDTVLEVRQLPYKEIGHSFAIRIFFCTLAAGPDPNDDQTTEQENKGSKGSMSLQLCGLATLALSILGIYVFKPEMVETHVVTICCCLGFSLCMLMLMEWGANVVLTKLMVAGHSKLRAPLVHAPARRPEPQMGTNGRAVEAPEGLPEMNDPPENLSLEEYEPTSVARATVRVGNTHTDLVQQAVTSWSSSSEEGRIRGVAEDGGKALLIEAQVDNIDPGSAIFTKAFAVVPHMDWMGRGVTVEAYLPCRRDLRTRPPQEDINASAQEVVKMLKVMLPAALTANQHIVQ